MKPYKQPGGPMTLGDPERCWIWPNEGRQAWLENLIPVNSADETSFGQGVGCAVQGFDLNDRQPLGTSAFAIGPISSELVKAD